MNGVFYIYVLCFLEGILTFISPCILPLLPVYFFYLAGVSAESSVNEGSPNRNNLLVNAIGFVIGFTLVFVLLGATATALGSFLKAHINFFKELSGIVMIIFGLNFMGVLKLAFINFEKRFEYNFKELGFLSSVIFGIVFGFGWTPCIGAFLSSALLMAGNSDTILQGVSMLLIYSLGLGIPFVLFSLLFDRTRNILNRLQRYNKAITVVSGIILVASGILVFTGKINYLSFLSW